MQVDADGRMGWSVTFRELNASEQKKYVMPEGSKQ